MTRRQLVTRYLWALLVAALLAGVIGRVHADAAPAPPPALQDECDSNDEDSTCFVIYRPGMCAHLEPYTYWWGFWGCENRNDLMSEAVTTTVTDETITTEITRKYKHGPDTRLVREQRRKK